VLITLVALGVNDEDQIARVVGWQRANDIVAGQVRKQRILDESDIGREFHSRQRVSLRSCKNTLIDDQSLANAVGTAALWNVLS
jgi:hypothetical protein